MASLAIARRTVARVHRRTPQAAGGPAIVNTSVLIAKFASFWGTLGANFAI
jgi:hypothetical protein